MNASLNRHRARGQSIPLIGAMIAVLFGMVALAVDVGNNYAEQRSVVRGTNAAALAGMSTLLAGGNDSDVANAIERSLNSNGIQVTNGAPSGDLRTLRAIYLGADGRQIPGGCSIVGTCGSQIPEGVKYIQVDVSGSVETYFARLFGASELGVNSSAYATRGVCTSGFYPFAIRSTVNNTPILDSNGFTDHDGYYQDEIYRQRLEYKTLYLRTGSNQSGAFNMIRWNPASQAAGNASVLAQMLEGDGNISRGYTELPEWPGDIAGLARPDEGAYPRNPGQYDRTDWVYGNYFANPDGIFDNADVRRQLEWHRQNRTVLTLPVYAYDNGDLTDPAYYVIGTEAFLLVGFGTDNDGVAPDGPWLQLAYLRPGGECATLTTPANPTTNLALSGTVSYVPRFRMPSNPDTQPIQYLVVLDVTGSMSWTFDGIGTTGGTDVNCVDGTVRCTGEAYKFRDESQRRIYIAKEVLRDFVERVTSQSADPSRADDMIKIVAFTGARGLYTQHQDLGSNSAALEELTQVLPAGDRWTNDRTELMGLINQAGDIGAGPYVTEGPTPSSVGLARAAQVFSTAPTKPTNPASPLRDTEYKRVVIFVTDGVANVFRNGLLNDINGCSSEIPSCHVGYVEGTSPRVPKPIEAMAQEGRALNQTYVLPTNGSTYVVALGGIDETKLDEIASHRDNVLSALDRSDLDRIFQSIQIDAEFGQCTAGFRPATDRMSVAEVPTDPRFTSVGVNSDTVGFVTLTDESGSRTVAPIIADASAGRQLSYQIGNLAPGKYTLSAWVAYRAPEDASASTGRTYGLLVTTSGTASEIVVGVDPGTLGGTVTVPITLDLSKPPIEQPICPPLDS
ncbi:MAG TPA: Tad domain-containing protein [Roseiflexaceae bacterium]|nr:Tad domain-containing protein [Roseiflexaceae bacterium]